MRKLLTLLVLFAYTTPLWSAVAFVGGTTVQCASAATCTITYTPTSTSNTIAICGAWANTITAPSIVDNAGSPVTLTAGAQFLTSAPNTALFYYTPGSGVTSFTINWTTSRASGFGLGEYSGVTSVTGHPTGETASGSGTSLLVSPTALESGDFAVGCGARATGTTPSGAVGTIREEIHAASPSTVLVDATSTGATATSTGYNIGSTGAWSMSAIILRPTAGGPPANQFPRVE